MIDGVRHILKHVLDCFASCFLAKQAQLHKLCSKEKKYGVVRAPKEMLQKP